jgi:sulfur-oxidizing protein SoxY
VPTSVLAADWNRPAFTTRNIGDALKAYGNAGAASESRDIVISAPEIAENGAKVEIEITSNIANTRSLAIFADKNPMPLSPPSSFPARPCLTSGPAESSRKPNAGPRCGKTSDGKTHVAFREIKVTLGGCGG